MDKFIKYFTAFEVVALLAILFNKKLSFLNFNIVVVTKGNYVVTKEGAPLRVTSEKSEVIKD